MKANVLTVLRQISVDDKLENMIAIAKAARYLMCRRKVWSL